MNRLCLALALAGLIIPALSLPAVAHKSSDSYLSLDVRGENIVGQWDIALRDLDYAIGLDTDGDGVITWGELREHQAAIAGYALANLTLEADGIACPATATAHLVDNHSDGAYEILRFAAACPREPQVLTTRYTLFFNLDPQHRGLLRVEDGGQTHTAVFGPNQTLWRLEGHSVAVWQEFVDYFHEGVWHIWTGFDHMLFLAALLLPAVLARQAGKWHAVNGFRDAFFDVLRIVTAFTIAHSITLSLAVLGYIALPSRLIESAIAASVVVAALNNLYPVMAKRLWMVAFAFGLIHGLGFANVLSELGLPRGALAIALVGFNLGVEAGQLAIVCLFLPLAFVSRRSWFYPRIVLGLGSICIVAIASVWLIERSLNLSFFA